MNIKKYLQENDISLKTMSEITTIPYATLSDIVNEKVDLYECKYKTLRKLSLFLQDVTQIIIRYTELALIYLDR